MALPAFRAKAAGKTAAKASPQKSWFARGVRCDGRRELRYAICCLRSHRGEVMDALIEARMQQARREIERHIQLLPYSLDERGNRLLKAGSKDMPFGGW